MKKILITLGMASVVSLTLMATPAYAGKVLLKVPVWFPTSLPALGTSPAWVAKQVNAMGGGDYQGSLKMKTYEPGALVPPGEMLEAVSKGQVNAGYTTPGYNTGILGDKGAIFSAVPFGPAAPEFSLPSGIVTASPRSQRGYHLGPSARANCRAPSA